MRDKQDPGQGETGRSHWLAATDDNHASRLICHSSYLVSFTDKLLYESPINTAKTGREIFCPQGAKYAFCDAAGRKKFRTGSLDLWEIRINTIILP